MTRSSWKTLKIQTGKVQFVRNLFFAISNFLNLNRRLSDSLLIPIPSPSGRMLKNNDEIFVDQEKLSQQKRDPVDDNALWNISKMKRDMRQLQGAL